MEPMQTTVRYNANAISVVKKELAGILRLHFQPRMKTYNEELAFNHIQIRRMFLFHVAVFKTKF